MCIYTMSIENSRRPGELPFLAMRLELQAQALGKAAHDAAYDASHNMANRGVRKRYPLGKAVYNPDR